MNVTRLLVSRYGFSKENRHRQNNIRIVISLAFCMASMLVILSAMQALSSSRIRQIRTYETFDLQVPVSGWEAGNQLVQALSAEKEIDAFVVAEEPAMLTAEGGGKLVQIRYLEESSPWFAKLHVQGEKGWMLSPMLSWRCKVSVGSKMEVSSIATGKQARVVPKRTAHTVEGTFRSGDETLDGSYVLAPLADAPANAFWYVALSTRMPADKVKHLVRATNPTLDPLSWKDLRASLYGALMLEQLVVRFVFLVLLCIILLSVKRAIERLVRGKRREIGTLYTMGLNRKTLVKVFLLESLCATMVGLFFGLCLGVVCMHLINRLGAASLAFSLPVLHVSVLPTVAVFLLVLSGSLLMAYLGMHGTVSLPLMEMLRDE